MTIAVPSFDLPLIRTLGKTYYWQKLLDSGEVPTKCINIRDLTGALLRCCSATEISRTKCADGSSDREDSWTRKNAGTTAVNRSSLLTEAANG